MEVNEARETQVSEPCLPRSWLGATTDDRPSYRIALHSCGTVQAPSSPMPHTYTAQLAM